MDLVTKEDLEAFQEKVLAELRNVAQVQKDILDRLGLDKREPPSLPEIKPGYLPALEYMRVIGIKRWKFNQLISENKIKAIKKKRKIYVPVSEIERYYKDPNVQ